MGRINAGKKQNPSKTVNMRMYVIELVHKVRCQLDSTSVSIFRKYLIKAEETAENTF
ncbi:hypothetical protein acsn021_08470 [Anaerocolumna cellulosilytica]|uniref:Uncharacterized protein n=1 Tax=Anaerocolumna cellulosilytica TaxID=433286 RepID=A0A6S6R2M0_9FIRM|nr:hypothetical protein acsn021_08470 [Anaerocolumna cellulosilytica]